MASNAQQAGFERNLGFGEVVTVKTLRELTSNSTWTTLQSVNFAVGSRYGLAPGYIDELVRVYSRSSESFLRLFEVRGNLGTVDHESAPRDAIEIRLSDVGVLVHEWASQGATSPLSLITGDLALGGARVPLSPSLIRAWAVDVEVDPFGHTGRLWPFGCVFKGSIRQSLSGKRTPLVLSPYIKRDGNRVVISSFPPRLSPQRGIANFVGSMTSAARPNRLEERDLQFIESVNFETGAVSFSAECRDDVVATRIEAALPSNHLSLMLEVHQPSIVSLVHQLSPAELDRCMELERLAEHGAS